MATFRPPTEPDESRFHTAKTVELKIDDIEEGPTPGQRTAELEIADETFEVEATFDDDGNDDLDAIRMMLATMSPEAKRDLAERARRL